MNLNNYYICEWRDEDNDYVIGLRYGEPNGDDGYIAKAELTIDKDGDCMAVRYLPTPPQLIGAEWQMTGERRFYKSANKARKNEYKHLQKLGKKHYNIELRKQRNAAELTAAFAKLGLKEAQ